MGRLENGGLTKDLMIESGLPETFHSLHLVSLKVWYVFAPFLFGKTTYLHYVWFFIKFNGKCKEKEIEMIS